MNKPRKVVSSSNYQTAGQPFEPRDPAPTVSKVETAPPDKEDDRVTAGVIPSEQEDATPGRRKLRPMWLIIPAVIALVVLAVIWGGAYFVEIAGQ
jgi:hypothetical protein